MAVVRRRHVPSSNDNKENKPKELEKKPIKKPTEIAREVREKMEQEKLEQERYNQEVGEEIIEEREEEMIMNDNENTIKEDNLENFTASKSKTISQISTEAGVMSLINSKNGRRITLPKDVMNKLNNPEVLSMSFTDNSLAVAERLPNNDNQFKVKSSGKKGIIYSAGLVSEITDKYGLDFSNRTSITFSEVNYVESSGYTVAIIKIR